ncbi:MAG: PIN domain-containing protein [Acidobacteriota bacterium]
MPRRYFVDTWFLIALTDRSDSDHHSAVRLDRSLRGAPFITHDAVLTEMLTFYSGEGAAARVIAVENARDAMRTYQVLPADRRLFLRALDLYEQRLDKKYSLVDCMSMIVMEDYGIQHVLTNDHHFAQAGFTVINQ